MGNVDQTVGMYQELAHEYDRQRDFPMRDRFWVLAADALRSAGRTDEAETIRERLLQVNPHHLLRPYSSFAESMKSGDVQKYLEGLRRNYPPETAAKMLEALREDIKEKPLARLVGKLVPGSSQRPNKAAELDPGIYRFQEEKSRAGARNGEGRRTAPDAAARWQTRTSTSWPDDELGGPEPAPGAWVGFLLFLILLVAGLAWAVLALVQPFGILQGR